MTKKDVQARPREGGREKEPRGRPNHRNLREATRGEGAEKNRKNWTSGDWRRKSAEDETALRYRLQMAVTRGREPSADVAGENGGRIVKRLLGIASTASVLLPQKEGDIGGVEETIDSTLRVTHMDGDRVRAYFGRCRQIEGVEMIKNVAREDVPVKIQTRGDLQSGLENGNHRNAVKYGGYCSKRQWGLHLTGLYNFQ